MQGTDRAQRSSRAAMLGGLVAMVTLTLGGCSNDDPRYHPSTLAPLTQSQTGSLSASPTRSPTPTGTQAMPDEAQVNTVYVEFIGNYRRAQDLDASERRPYLARWMADPGLGDAVRVFAEQQRNHQRSTGKLVPRIISTHVSGDSATVNACVDQRKFNLVDSRTGKVLTAGGSPTYWAVASLRRTAHGWRIVKLTDRRKKCALQ